MIRVCASVLAALLAIGFAPAFGSPDGGLDLTPPQIEGPYYPVRKPAEIGTDLTHVGVGPRAGPQAKGEVLVLNGKVLDSRAEPLAGAVVEIWQADAQGIYRHPRDPRVRQHDPAFPGYGRATVGDTGTFAFRTIVPGRYEGRPPHIHVKITPPGGRTLTTQLYFKGDADLATDGIATALGKALDLVTLAPTRANAIAEAPLEATITLVVARGRRNR